MRDAPIHSTATLATFTTRLTTGKVQAIRRLARNEVSVRSALALANRARSCGSRTKARMTRMPVICSRRMRLMPSRRTCISRNAGTIRATIDPSRITAAGMATARITDRPTS